MLNRVDFGGRPFHFIGIGGIGMSALAHVLVKHKLPVSGSDARLNPITEQLQHLGVRIFPQQEATNLLALPQLPQVVCSTAIHADNPEYKMAVELGCPILHRSDLLAALIERYQSIAVAGTHGKTTTSSMIGYLLLQGGVDPTIIIGGEVQAWEGNARTGMGEYLVAEADESDGSLAKFAPQIGVITNIELDHPDHYSNLEQVIKIFETFANHCQTVVACWDCPTIRDRLTVLPDQSVVSYSLFRESGADYSVDQISYGPQGTLAQVWERGELLGELSTKLLGAHNLKNALAAVAVGRLLGLDFITISRGIARFEGARRRFEVRGEAHGIRFVDDYAHHPSEIRATLAAGRLQLKSREEFISPWQRLVAVFQPHRYTRTFTFLTEFSQAFGDADLVVLTDIYSAGERDRLVQGQHLADCMAEYHAQVQYQPSLEEVKLFLKQTLRPGDLVLVLGAGNLNQIIPELLDYYQTLPIETISEVVPL
uniref:UDP-N-acetylmuramate--L-alanine ligase n=1 Tax=Cyanothece sp. (strain PCC 7425 / ATCC 29141) TaxID=395961 RepID=MURC_CYAP4|nr:RecName: Full=UDP-N-acetylmuramate--L-alanine ligase; AltName: Full=UDP-N-acetylmuramoyl-L-alanine synthetase [Cyanothece sp. PCC 7425]